MERLRARKFEGLSRFGNEMLQSFEAARDASGVAFDEGVLSTRSYRLSKKTEGNCLVYGQFSLSSNTLFHGSPPYSSRFCLLEVYAGKESTLSVFLDSVRLGTISGTKCNAEGVSGKILLLTDQGMWTVEATQDNSGFGLYPVFPDPQKARHYFSVSSTSDTKTIDALNYYAVFVRYATTFNESGTSVVCYALIQSDSKGMIIQDRTIGVDLSTYKGNLRTNREWKNVFTQEFYGVILGITTEFRDWIVGTSDLISRALEIAPSGYGYTGRSASGSESVPLFEKVESGAIVSGSSSFSVPVDCLVTAVVSGSYEHPVWTGMIDVDYRTRLTSAYILTFTPTKTVYDNITGFKLYVREWKDRYTRFEQDEDGDYEQIAYYNHIHPELFRSTLYSRMSKNGMMLSQALGYSYLHGRLPLPALDDYRLISGLAYGLKDGMLYSAVVGSGSIQNTIFHEQFVIPNVTSKPVVAIEEINGALGVFTRDELITIVSQDVGGAYVHSVKSIQGMGVRDTGDIAVSPDAVAIFTDHGLYVTDGQSAKIVNEPLFAEMRERYDTLNILYSGILKELYVQDSETLLTYVYSFKYDAWTSFDSDEAWEDIEEFNHATYIRSNGAWHALSVLESGRGYWRSPRTQLEAEDVIKLPVSATVDFSGTIGIGQSQYHASERMTLTIPLPLDDRIPSRHIGLSFELLDAKVYGLTLNYLVIGEQPRYAQPVQAHEGNKR